MGQSCARWAGRGRRCFGVPVWPPLERQAGSRSGPGPGTGPSALGWPVSSAGCSPAPAGSYGRSAP